jgi:hypothetical protein
VKFAVAVCLSIVLWSCGPSSVAHHEQCPLIGGSFNATSTLESTDGSCGKAKAHSFDRYDFDSEGAFVSHLDPLVNCRTDQEDCSISIRCTTNVIDAKADFEGTLSRDGSELIGTATFSGQYQGCSKVVYRVVALQPEARRADSAEKSAPPAAGPECPSKGPRMCETPIER